MWLSDFGRVPLSDFWCYSRNTMGFSLFNRPTSRWTLARDFRLISLIVVILGTLVIGSWTGSQIKTSIINETASATALYLDSFVVPHLQELDHSDQLTRDHSTALQELLSETNLGRRVVAVKVWDKHGEIVYSNIPDLIGLVFQEAEELAPAWHGEVVAKISDLDDEENFIERQSYSRLLEIYLPVRLSGTHQIIAVAEFYQEVDALEDEIITAQRQSWTAVIIAMAIIYLLLVGFVQRASNRIFRQEIALQNQVAQLREVLSFNEELDQRVRRASANATTLNERLLRRVSAELHASPIQDIEKSLLKLDQAMQSEDACKAVREEDLPIIKNALATALEELQAIAGGLGLPQLDDLSMMEIVTRAVQTHKHRTGTDVKLEASNVPLHVSLPIKITVYRLIQEALNNAHRHAGGAGQRVAVTCYQNQMKVEVSDKGPGFDYVKSTQSSERLGLVGMRERVESLGGQISIHSEIGHGTTVTAYFTISNSEDRSGG